MEKLPQNALEKDRSEIENTGKESEELLPHEKFDILLGLFGTNKAREKFLEICKNYLSARITTDIQINTSNSENYSTKKIPYSPPGRALLHNIIMDTISKLAVETRDPTEVQSQVLRDFYSREEIAKAIKSYFAHEIKQENIDDEDELEKKKIKMSGPAYFHSLGREH